jgi:amino acid adenylation domain-containing protein
MNEQRPTGPASLIQRQFWVLHRRDPQSPAYNIPSIALIEGDLNVAALEAALNAIICRHDVFRATFEMEDAKTLVQRTAPWRWSPLLQDDLRGSKEAAEGRLGAEGPVLDEIRRPFLLASEPPLRSRLFQTGDRSHVLAITAHHIAFDLRTKDLFAEELAAEYQALAHKRALPDRAQPAGYQEFSQWQETWIKGDECREMGERWRRYLDGAEPMLSLPHDQQKAAGSLRTGTVVPWGLSAGDSGRVRDFCRQEATSPFLVLLTAWALTLARWSGQTKLTLGVPLTNRRRAEFQSTMGCFVNILPLVFDVSDNPTLLECVRRVRAGMLQMHRMQEMPYYHLVQLMRHGGSWGANALFQAGFTFEHPMRLQLDGVQTVPMYVHHGGAQLDVFGTFWEEGDAISGVLEYDMSVFEPATIGRVGESLRVAIQKICEEPRGTVRASTLVPAGDLGVIVATWNRTGVQFDESATIDGLIEAQSAKTPEAPAIEFGSALLSYRQLQRQARALAAHLRSLGALPEEPIGVCVQRNLDMVPVLLGVLSAGCAYLPLDPTFPIERLRFMIEDAGVRFVVGSAAFRTLFALSAGGYVEIDENAWTRFEAAAQGADPKRAAGALAYVIYTSGSTGKPKGVEVPHKAVVNLLASMRKQPGFAQTDRLLSVTTVSFDISVLELFLPLSCGACTILAPDEAIADGERLLALLRTARPTMMQGTPVTWRLLIAAGWEGTPGLKALCGGEAMSADLMHDLLGRCGEVWNMYGPTETTVWSTGQKCERWMDRVSIGRPIDNTVTYVLDEEGSPVPVGVWGELYIGGAGLARGYRNRLQLTSERFVPDRLTPSGGRLYRTGDRCRFSGDGSIECSGRMDRQVKVRGYRIEPGEIEAALDEHPGVKGSAVDAREDAGGDRRLIAWVVPREGQQPDAAQLRQYLRGRLPDYLIPQIFVPVASFPLTPNRKVDRKALPDPRVSGREPIPKLSAEREGMSAEERGVRNTWENLLAHGDFRNDDRFFDSGGDSMLALRLRDLLESQWNIEVPVSMIFQFPTVRQQAEFLRLRGKTPSDGAAFGTDRGRMQAAALARRRRKNAKQRSDDEQPS